MNEQIEELIALGASVTAHCQPCLQHHVARATELGISKEDIQHAIEIGRMVSRGAESAFRQYEKQLFAEPAEKSSSSCCGGSGCC